MEFQSCTKQTLIDDRWVGGWHGNQQLVVTDFQLTGEHMRGMKAILNPIVFIFVEVKKLNF